MLLKKTGFGIKLDAKKTFLKNSTSKMRYGQMDMTVTEILDERIL